MNEVEDLIKLSKLINNEYLRIVSPILENKEFQKRLKYHHHENRSVYVHSLMVSYNSYRIAKILHLDYERAAIGGLLHDFYYEDWQLAPKKKKKLFHQHGFIHPYEALENSKKYFSHLIDDKVSDIIVRHMFPLTIIPPRYLESWIITMVDKYISFEVFKEPKKLYKYIGIRPKEKKV